MRALRIILILACCVATALQADVNARNGVAITTDTDQNGVTAAISQVNGIAVVAAGGGGSAPTFVEVVVTSFDDLSSPTVDIPAASLNRVYIAIVTTNTASDITAPPGWNKEKEEDGADETTGLLWRRSDGAESDTQVWTSFFAAVEDTVIAIFAYDGCTTTGNPFDVVASGQNAGSTSHSASITTTVANTRVLVAFGVDPTSSAGRFTWSTGTERLDSDTAPSGERGSLVSIHAADVAQASPGLVTLSGTRSAAESSTWVAIALKP